jgi:membrane-associated phospholipid phosphatase
MPPIIASLTFVLINYTLSSGLAFVALTLLMTLVAAVVPLSIVAVWALRKRARDIDIDEGAGRMHWLLVSMISYVIGAAILLLIRAPSLITVVAFGYGAVMFVFFFINLRWKISGHTMGIAVPTTVLTFVFGPWGLLCGSLLPPVAWSRVYLKKHTIAQVIAGALVGFSLTALVLWLLLP